MSSSRVYGEGSHEYVPISWREAELLVERLSCSEQDVTPIIRANTEKGFFIQEGDYTTYRRNYFSVLVAFELQHVFTNHPLTVKHEGQEYQIKAFGMRIAAAVDQPNGKVIDLVQHTPKRDNGPKTKVEIAKVCPTPANAYVSPFHATMGFEQQLPPAIPALPFQQDVAGGLIAGVQYGHQPSVAAQMALAGQSTSHIFDRIQFKNATANNGKRRASQQYFLLKVELWADVRDALHDPPVWVKVAHKVSQQLIVRGRSPSHYSADIVRRNNRGGGGGGGGGGSGSASGSGTGARGGLGARHGGGFGGNMGVPPGSGAGARGFYPHDFGHGYRGVQGQLGFPSFAGVGMPELDMDMFEAQTPNTDYLSTPVPSISSLPSLDSSPVDNQPPLDFNMLGLCGYQNGQSTLGRHEVSRDSRLMEPFHFCSSLTKARLTQNGDRRDSHRDHHRRRPTTHSAAVTTPSPAFPHSDFDGDEKNVYYFSPGL